LGRSTLDDIYADLFGAEQALVRMPLEERIFIERMTSGCKLKASREGSK